ncbi:tetratricopeptide repeat protein [Zavarzinella formosa]|uniref:tetratricopeptide repeat protein n=1 Tax=Zavarzinella formosa TaxID=360055 RepID=UPI000300D0A2|nr:tetratricopeptide repeat protein [Zavarzinella formosa]
MKQMRFIAAGLLIAGIAVLAIGSATNADYWRTADQHGDELMRRQQPSKAAKVYRAPSRQAAAQFRAGEFKSAAAAFATIPTAEGAYNRGNSLMMLGKYADAIKSYDRALELRPGWADAEENRVIARVRRDRMTFKGGDETGGQVKPDEAIFEKGKNPNPGEDTEVAGGQQLTDEELRGLWLRRVQTKPADFLRAKFSFQARAGKDGTP